jgi:hypothetical protein
VAGVFPTASSPTGSTPALAAPPPGVGNFPSLTLSNEFVKVRFFEPSVPEAVNKRWLGMPRGVYVGFVPSSVPGSRVVNLTVDPQQNFSLLRVPSSSDRVMVDIFTSTAVDLDFSAHTVWPVYVLATSNYTGRTATQGKIFTRASNANGIDEIVICRVDKVGNNLVVDVTEPTNRQEPVAFNSQPYGYMPDGSIESLATTNASVAEVIGARSSTYTGPHATLKDRLDGDMVGSAMADRLGLRLVQVISNVHLGRSGTSANVSASFTQTGRQLAPIIDIASGGTEVVEGAITTAGRNFVFPINATTGQRLIDDVTREPVYGQMTFSSANIGAPKQVFFVNASTSVNGSGTNPFTAPLQEGDTLAGPDGLFYEVLTIVDPDNAILGAAYQGADASILNPVFNRWLVFFFTVSGGAFNLTTPTPIQVLFPCFFRVDRAIFEGLLLVKREGERPQLPVATTTAEGKALLASDGGLVGSFRTIKNAGSSVGSHIHTLNFPNGGAVASGSPGVVNVSVPGAAGAAGPGANQGPDGPTGAAGFGYSVNNTFEVGPESGDTVTAGTAVSVSHTVDWTAPSSTPTLAPGAPRAYAHVTGGWSIFNGFSGYERIHIDSLTNVDANNTRIIYRVQPDLNLSFTTIQCFMGASQ